MLKAHGPTALRTRFSYLAMTCTSMVRILRCLLVMTYDNMSRSRTTAAQLRGGAQLPVIAAKGHKERERHLLCAMRPFAAPGPPNLRTTLRPCAPGFPIL